MDPKLRRRQALAVFAGLSAVSSLPGRWRKPVIDTVMLPVHAQASLRPTSPINPDPVNPPSPTDSTNSVDPEDPVDPGKAPPDDGKNLTPAEPPKGGIVNGVLSGRILGLSEKNATPVGNAGVFLTGLDNPDDFSTFSDAQGNYRIELPPGRYAVVVERSGYAAWSSFPDSWLIISGVITNENINLVSTS